MSDAKLIQDIYDTALNPSALPEVLQELSERIGAHGAMIFDCVQGDKGRYVDIRQISTCYDWDATLAYAKKYNAQELADQDHLADLSLPTNGINLVHDKRLYLNGRQPMENVDAMKRRGISDRLGGLLSKEAWNTGRFAFQYAQGTPFATQDQILWAENILSHLSKAITMADIVTGHKLVNVGFATYLDSMSFGIAIVNSNSNILYANQEFNRIIQDYEGVSKTQSGQLTFKAHHAEKELSALLTQNDAHGRFGARPRREAIYLPTESDKSNSGLFVEICPIKAHPDLSTFENGSRVVTILDGSREINLDFETLSLYFPLSQKEMEVLERATLGYSNTEIAQERDRSVETVKSQLKSVMRKMGARNRTELVRVGLGFASRTTEHS